MSDALGFEFTLLLLDIRSINFPMCSHLKHFHYPSARETSREVANLTEIKNLHTLVYGIKNLTPIISGLAEENGLIKN